jgi:hypothetical protein
MTFRVRHDGTSVRARRGVIGSRLWLMALPVGVLGAGLAAPSAGVASALHERVTGSLRAYSAARQGDPTQTIDARTNPQQAGQELNSGCANLSKCSWQTTPNTQITSGYGPFKIIGDALYNCTDPSNEQAYSETAVSISDSREDSISLSESVSVEVGGGILGFEKASVEGEVNSGQMTAFKTEYTSTTAASVAPGWKGWNQYRVLTAFVSGTVYVTDGINLIAVKDIDLSYPGFKENGTADTPIDHVTYTTPMSATDIATRCNATGVGVTRGGARPTRVNTVAKPTGRLKLTLCQAHGRCDIRTVTGIVPPAVERATATLTQAGRAFATGTDTNGSIRLTLRRPIKPGTYILTISQRSGRSPRSHPGSRTTATTVVPIAIR